MCVCRSYNKTHERRDQHYFMRVLLLAQHHQQATLAWWGVGVGIGLPLSATPKFWRLEETPNSNPNIAAAFATSHDLAVICLRSVLQELTKKRPGDGDKSVNKTWTSTLHNATNTRRRASCSHHIPENA